MCQTKMEQSRSLRPDWDYLQPLTKGLFVWLSVSRLPFFLFPLPGRPRTDRPPHWPAKSFRVKLGRPSRRPVILSIPSLFIYVPLRL
jgi:hypothetical protein